MNARIAIALMTKDRVELTKRSIEPLLDSDRYDLHIFDGSKTEEGQFLPHQYAYYAARIWTSVIGGADPAVLRALTELYDAGYDFIGIVENDVLLHKDWFGPTMALFARGKDEGLTVGAVSARCYQDRILIQRDGYVVCHNLGYGQIIMSRGAVKLVLQHNRNSFTDENVAMFSQLANLDIRRWWAFRASSQFITADWGSEKILAAHGLAALALTPSHVEMIGQVPSLAEQGLEMADGRFELLRNPEAFKTYRDRLQAVREGQFEPTFNSVLHDSQGWLYFTHQLGHLGAQFNGDWRLQWAQGFGPFAWKAGTRGDMPDVAMKACTVPILGPCTVIVSGGEHGGKVMVEDEQSGYECSPQLGPESTHGALQLTVPGTVAYRNIRITAQSPGVVLYGIRTPYRQPHVPYEFDWNKLPPV